MDEKNNVISEAVSFDDFVSEPVVNDIDLSDLKIPALSVQQIPHIQEVTDNVIIAFSTPVQASKEQSRKEVYVEFATLPKTNELDTTNNDHNLDVATAVTLQEFAVISHAEEHENSVDTVANDIAAFAAFEVEYKRRKQMMDEYMKRKAKEELEKEEADSMKQQKEWENSKNEVNDVQKQSEDLAEESGEESDVKTIGVISPFSFLISQVPYDFQKFIPLDMNESKKRREKNTVWVSNDHVPIGIGIADKYVYNRLHFCGKKSEGNNFQVR